jgi:uncharacterized protein YneF (UPF0154 family)
VIRRSIAVWLLILILAVLNGAVRDAWLVPRLGDPLARALSSVTLSALAFLTTFATIPWIQPVTARQAWWLGALWIVLTLAFEFLAGHYAFRRAWPDLLSDYNLRQGRIWLLVLVTTFVSPWCTARLRHLFGP